MTNNPALHDAVLAAIAASNEAWLTEDQDTNPAEVIAEEVDANIPAVVGGARYWRIRG
jgi:hypothetical protein